MLGNLIEYRRAAGAGEEMQTTWPRLTTTIAVSLTNAVAARDGEGRIRVTRNSGTRSDKQRSKFMSDYPPLKRVDAILGRLCDLCGIRAPQSFGRV